MGLEIPCCKRLHVKGEARTWKMLLSAFPAKRAVVGHIRGLRGSGKTAHAVCFGWMRGGGCAAG